MFINCELCGARSAIRFACVKMLPPKENVDLECFIVTKHSWKGKYKRVLSIGTAGISTYNPDRFDLTNRWSYSDIVAAAPSKTTNVSAIN